MFDASFILAVSSNAHAEETAAGNPLTQIIDNFHISWGSFLAQLICFLIVAFLLKKFAFGPIQEMLEKRRARIADGEAKLEEIEKRLAESEKETERKIDEANAQAKRMIEEAKESAASLGERKAQEAVTAAQGILAKAEEAARQEREQMQTELKKEFGRLVAATTAQVSGKVLSDDDQRRINEEALQSVQN